MYCMASKENKQTEEMTRRSIKFYAGIDEDDRKRALVTPCALGAGETAER